VKPWLKSNHLTTEERYPQFYIILWLYISVACLQHAWMYVSMNEWMYHDVSIKGCMYEFMYVSMYACMHACMHVRIRMYIRMYARTYVRMYVCTYVRIYECMCKYIYTHVSYRRVVTRPSIGMAIWYNDKTTHDNEKKTKTNYNMI